jgi:hypothetical protein
MEWATQSGVFVANGNQTTIDHLTAEQLRAHRFAFPPLPEQVAIATFLDHETSKIEKLIEGQKRLIELLNEKRQAVISHAVTKGPDSNAPIKDNGVALLGDVPVHWNIKPLMYLTEQKRPIMYGIVLPGPNVESGVPIVKGGDVKEHRLKLNLLNRTTPEIEAPFARARPRPGDIVYMRSEGLSVMQNSFQTSCLELTSLKMRRALRLTERSTIGGYCMRSRRRLFSSNWNSDPLVLPCVA